MGNEKRRSVARGHDPQRVRKVIVMLDKRKGPGAGGTEDPLKDDSAEHRSNSEKGDGSKVPPDCLAPERSGKGRKASGGIDTLPIPKRMKNLIGGIDDPEHRYASPSEAVLAVIIAMVGGGCADDQI